MFGSPIWPAAGCIVTRALSSDRWQRPCHHSFAAPVSRREYTCSNGRGERLSACNSSASSASFNTRRPKFAVRRRPSLCK